MCASDSAGMRLNNTGVGSYDEIMTPSQNSHSRDESAAAAPGTAHHLCPWWLGYALVSPVRRLVESPERLLGPHVRPGMTVVEPAAWIRTTVCRADDLGVAPWIASTDLAVAIHLIHEVSDCRRLLGQLHAVLRPGGSLLVVEPKGHVSTEDFDRTADLAVAAGFGPARSVSGRGLAAVFARA
jgi:hypothetical protein